MTTPASSSATRRGSLGLSGAFDLLEDVDFESTMMVLEQSESANSGALAAARRRLSSVLRRGSLEQLDFSLSSLAELFPAGSAGDSIDALSMFSDDQLAAALNHMTSGQTPAASRRASTVDHLNLKVRAPGPTSNRSSAAIKAEFPHSPPALLSPTMDSFLRDSWGDINDLESKTRRTSSKLLEGLLGHSLLSPTGATPRRLSVKLPGAASLPMPPQQLGSPTRLGMVALFPSAAAQMPSAPLSAIKPLVSAVEPKARPTKPRATPKQPRRAKQCVEPNCPRRAQSNNRCKTHGGGARCQMEGCDKSSQGGGLCRAHGGGKKCRVAGCTKGTQRLGLCYLHGGIRRCVFEGCKKKDRGNGYCISHGGGRRCEVAGCERSVRKGDYCQTHQGLEGAAGRESPFNISRGQGLHVS